MDDTSLCRADQGKGSMCEDAGEAAGPSVDDHATVGQTLGQFIAEVIEAARKRADFDPALLAILTKHIVKEDLRDEAVRLAAAQIEALAEARASASEKGHPDGEDNA